MEATVQIDPTIQKLFIFDEVYTAPAAREQAERRKLDAFGMLARLNPLQRPRPETVELVKWELRYEPFWHVTAERSVEYERETIYHVPVRMRTRAR